jgi:4'-phosphopantetheinyl transferase
MRLVKASERVSCGLGLTIRDPQLTQWPPSNVVEVVACGLVVGAVERTALERLLSPEEVDRASRFRAAGRRDAFVVARGRLRQLLALATGCPAAGVVLALDRGGKPRLAHPAGTGVRFNLSHSGELMLCAVTRDRDVGVDVERIDEAAAREAVAARVFAPPERRALRTLPPSRRPAAFFAGWTRKEAVVKATGEGLARPLGSFVVSLDPEDATMQACDAALGAPEGWLIAPVPVPEGYQAAVAVRDGRGAVAVRLTPWEGLLARTPGAA